MKMDKLLWNILFSNQKPVVFGVFQDLEPLVLLQNLKGTCRRMLYLVKFQAVGLHLY